MFLYESYSMLKLGSVNFWKKLEKMVERDMVNKKIHLDSDEVAGYLNAFAMKNCKNQKLW